jgi:Fe2+ or Zn2+ uptake regulation protein
VTAADQLRAAGERVTPQRVLVAETLRDAGRQLSAQELWRRVRLRLPGVGRATVFRTLEALVGAGAARRLEREGHVSAYVACRPVHHHHLVCTSCGRVEEIDEAFVRPMADQLADRRGFVVDDARLDFYGRCARCATGRERAAT